MGDKCFDFGLLRLPFQGSSILMPQIDKVIFNNPATIVFFNDGSKTVVKAMEGQEYNPDYGFMLCIMKKVYGNNYHKIMWKYCWGGQEARRAHRKEYKLANKAKDGKDEADI